MRDDGIRNPSDSPMSIISISIIIGQWAGIGGCCLLLLKFTALPFWAAFLIALPVGTILGTLAGFGLGMAIAYAREKRQRNS